MVAMKKLILSKQNRLLQNTGLNSPDSGGAAGVAVALSAGSGPDMDIQVSVGWNDLFDSVVGGGGVYCPGFGLDHNTVRGRCLNRFDGGERDTARVREGMVPGRVRSGGGGENGLGLRNEDGGMTDSLTVDSCFTIEVAKADRVTLHGGTLDRGAGDFNGGDVYECRQGDEMSGLSGGDTLGGYCGGNDTLLDFTVLSDWNSREDEGVDFTSICEEVDGVASGNSRELKAIAECRHNLSMQVMVA